MRNNDCAKKYERISETYWSCGDCVWIVDSGAFYLVAFVCELVCPSYLVGSLHVSLRCTHAALSGISMGDCYGWEHNGAYVGSAGDMDHILSSVYENRLDYPLVLSINLSIIHFFLKTNVGGVK